MTKQAKPEAEAPQASVADLASLLRAVVYTEDAYDRIGFSRVAKTFLAEHEHEIGNQTVTEAKRRTREIEKEQERSLWSRCA